jgi:hypothetical protein
MAQRRFHYEQAFEHYLRANRVPYVAVDEAKKALMPAAAKKSSAKAAETAASLKSFDFVVYAPHGNLLVDVKGRMFGSGKAATSSSNRRYESWVTQDDVDSLAQWQKLFGQDFTAVFVFVYCLRQQPPDALFDEVFAFGGKWYALREARFDDYVQHMVPRSANWHTVHVPAEPFARISRPFLVRQAQPSVAIARPASGQPVVATHRARS